MARKAVARGLTGKMYGSGSSRDWAAKGPSLLGIRAESYEGQAVKCSLHFVVHLFATLNRHP